MEDDAGEDLDTEDKGNSFNDKWAWLAAVDEASETIREPWKTVLEMPVMEFLNLLCYSRDKANEKRRMMEEWKMKQKVK